MLVIEYVHEGHLRGYNFTSPTQGIDDAVLKQVWRSAMPRGQGWGAEAFAGAQTLKTFGLDDGRVALSQVIVTDQVDDAGRRGIRRAEITLYAPSAYLEALELRLTQYSSVVRATADRMLTLCQRTRIIEKTLPKIRKEPQVILSHPFTSPAAWQVIEVVALRLALHPPLPLRRWGRIIPFTTLALDYRDEGKIVALPTSKAQATAAHYVPLR